MALVLEEQEATCVSVGRTAIGEENRVQFHFCVALQARTVKLHRTYPGKNAWLLVFRLLGLHRLVYDACGKMGTTSERMNGTKLACTQTPNIKNRPEQPTRNLVCQVPA
jgi:hypothetical protein